MDQPSRATTLRLLILWFLGFFLVLAVLLFLPAGGLGWPKGWLFLLVFFFQCVLSTIYVWRTNPEVVVALCSSLPSITLTGVMTGIANAHPKRTKPKVSLAYEDVGDRSRGSRSQRVIPPIATAWAEAIECSLAFQFFTPFGLWKLS